MITMALMSGITIFAESFKVVRKHGVTPNNS